MKLCFNCGAQLEAELKFCPECGQEITQSAADAPPKTDGATPPAEESVPVGKADEVVYGQPVIHDFSAPSFSESRQAVAHTYGESVEHCFAPPTQSEAALCGTYEIPKPTAPEMHTAKEKPAKTPKEKAPKEPKAPKASKEPKAPKEPKERNEKLAALLSNKKLLIIIAAAIVVILAIIIIACSGGKGDLALGLYNCVSSTYMETKLDTEEEWIELSSRGKGTLKLMGDEYSVKWSLDGEEFTLSQAGDEYTGTLKDGTLTINFADVIYVYKQADGKNDSEVGYWTLKYSEGNSQTAMDEETVAMLKEFGYEIYIELYEDGTGTFCFEEEFEITWKKGSIFAEGEEVKYSLENGEFILTIEDAIFHFVRAEGENGIGEAIINLNINSPETYVAVSGRLDDIELDEERLAELGDFSVTFYGNGDGEMRMSGKTIPISYDNSIIIGGGIEMPYDYDYGTIYLYVGEKIEFTLEYAGVPDTLPEELLSPADLQYWSGDYYGWWGIENVISGDAGTVGDWWDCCASLDIDSEGYGTLTIWDESSSKKSPLAKMDVSVSISGGAARVVSEEGQFLDDEIEHADWLFYSDVSAYEDSFEFVVGYEDEETQMDCYFILRPWGTIWDDVEADTPEDLPYYYYDWYLPLLNDGVETAPNKIS